MSTDDDFLNDDFNDVVVSPGAVVTADADTIAKENSFGQVPPGRQLLRILKVPRRPEEKHVDVVVGGARDHYESLVLPLRFCMPDAENFTIEDYFHLPPGNPADMNAYLYGIAVDGPDAAPRENAKAGFQANKFFHFVQRIGFAATPGAPLPAEALSVRNWLDRQVIAFVEAPRKATEGDRQSTYNRIKLFSYEAAPPGQVRWRPKHPGTRVDAGPPPARPAPPARSHDPADDL